MKLELWLDLVCPWCYLGKRRLEEALGSFEHRDEVQLTLHSFELDPQAPAQIEGTVAEMLARKYGSSASEVEARQQQLVELGREAGIDYRFDLARHGNTFNAHRLIHLARSQGIADAVAERLMHGYFTEGMAIGDAEALVTAAAEAGLDADAARAVLSGDELVSDVRADEQRGAALGIQGVPFLVLDDQYGVSGAQPAEAFLQALNTAWDQRTGAAAAA